MHLRRMTEPGLQSDSRLRMLFIVRVAAFPLRKRCGNANNKQQDDEKYSML